MTITKDMYVSFHYTLKDVEGNIIDSSQGKNPLSYIHDSGMIIQGLEKALEGRIVGEKFTVTVSPQDAYGEYNDRLILSIPRDQFEDGSPIEVGMPFQAVMPNGTPVIVRIKEISGDTITVDGNHELAGKTLVFDIEIVEVRESTEEERNPPHCGGCGGCGGCGNNCGEECGGNCKGECDGNCKNECNCN
ncbi:MAG: peptidylprolyl isomerase [Treponema sp.]|nr:peptidylprolyl isomerase [Treponema sp.]